MQLLTRAWAMLVFLCTGMYGQASYNMDLLGNLNERRAPGRYSACWGYTTPDGHEYALLGCYNGTAIIDITADPIVEVDFIPGPSSGWREMKTYRHYAYIVTESSNTVTGGVQIVDLSFLPDSAMVVKNYVWVDTVDQNILSFPAVHSISVSGNYLYLNGGSNYPGGMRILDISDPVNPQQAGYFPGPYVHDSFVRNDTVFASCLGNGLLLLDVKDKANPTIIKEIQYPGSGTHNAWTTVDRKYVFTTDEIGTTSKSLKVWDIQDLDDISKVVDYSNTTAIVHNVFIKGTLAYVAWYTQGLQVINIADPLAPQAVAFYDTFPANDDATYDGIWGADPFFPSGKVIASDMQTGLYVFRYPGDERGIVQGLVTDYWTGAPLPDVLLHFPDLSMTRFTGANGNYLFGYAPGTYRVILERPGYGTVETSVTVVKDSTVTVNFSPFALTNVALVGALPSSFSLYQNYPNPFNPSTTIPFELPKETHVSLRVFNSVGMLVATLVDGVRPPGKHDVIFDGSKLSSGVYFSVFRTVTEQLVRPMILLK